MSELVWEWLVADEAVSMRIDPAAGLETVYLGRRLVSRLPSNLAWDGHVVSVSPKPASGPGGAFRAPASVSEINVRYVPRQATCQLVANGSVIPPTRVPAPVAPPPAPSAPNLPTTWPIVIGIALIVCLIGAVFAVRAIVAGPFVRAPAGSLAASTGLLIAHYPAGFVATQTTKQEEMTGGRTTGCPQPTCTMDYSIIEIANQTHRTSSLVLASYKMNGVHVGADPWHASNKMLEQIYAAQKRHGDTFTESDRQNTTCFDEPGAKVTGRLQKKNGTEEIWETCSFIHETNMFLFITVTDAKHVDDKASLVRIMDSTELRSTASGT